ncbi:MAG: hypothetical protein PHG25_00055 [Candidatus Pacebacteria bacterium]|nr:hypothetical protein [Candidatus Paceibacterota bacterium]
MKTNNGNCRIIITCLVVFNLWVIRCKAQDFTPDLADQWNQQFLLQNKVISGPAPSPSQILLMQNPNLNPPQTETNESEWEQWSLKTFSVQYGFGFTHSFQNGSHTKKNSGTLSTMFSAPFGFTLSPSLAVSGSSVESLSGSDTSQSISINPSLQIGHDVTTNLFGGKLSVFGKTGYTATDSSSGLGAKPAFSQMSGWAWGGGANYAIDATTNLQVSLSPSYTYNQNQTVNVPLGTTTSTFQGNVAVKLGLAYKISPKWGVSTYGTWLRNINFSTAPGQSETHQDWARFGGDVIYSWNKASLDLGYSYDAFNSSYFTHAVTLQLKFKF